MGERTFPELELTCEYCDNKAAHKVTKTTSYEDDRGNVGYYETYINVCDDCLDPNSMSERLTWTQRRGPRWGWRYRD